MKSGRANKVEMYGSLMCILFIAFIVADCKKREPVYPEPPRPVYPQIDHYPSWSPDGSTIVFFHMHVTRVDTWGSHSINSDSTGIWFINVSGSSKRMFLKGLYFYNFDWSPNGEWLVFSQAGKIYKIKINGDSLTQLTFEGSFYHPRWSPDGKYILFINYTPLRETLGIWVMESYKPGSKKFWNSGYFADWYPGGEFIIYCDGSSLWKEKIDHSEKYYFTEGVCTSFKISPDGSKILFAKQESGEAYKIWVMDINSSNLYALDVGVEPDWSPDGSKVVYVRYDWRSYDPYRNGVLYIINSDGTGKKQLTFGPKP
jgi:Tol biopolymer transport system component